MINYEELGKIRNFFFNKKSDLESLKIPSHPIRDYSTIPKNISDNTNETVVPEIFFNNENYLETPQPNQTRKRKIFSIKENGIVWENIFGKTYETLCKICQKNKMKALNKDTWHMGHIKSFIDQGSDDLSNIRPICVSCNKSMGRKHLVEYCKEKYPNRWKEILSDLKIPY